MNKVMKRVSAVVALSMGAISAAHAELPATIGAAVTTGTADVIEAGGLILGVVVAIAAIGWVRRVIR